METKECTKCGITKTINEFNKDKLRKDGFEPACRKCNNTRQKKWRDKQTIEYHRDRQRKWKLKGFNMSLSEYNYYVSIQDGKCAICHCLDETGDLCVDHDHVTNKIRGMLCKKCNLAIGHLKDSPVNALSAARYLIKHKAKGINWELLLDRLLPILDEFLDIKVNNAHNTATSGKTA
jgi:hypothetical protein